MARSGSCHFSRVSRLAETGSYGKWQDPDLATFRASRDRADLGSYGERQDPDLATFRGVDNGKIWILPLLRVSRLAETGSYGEWQDPDLATFRGVDNGKIWILPLFKGLETG